MKQKKRFVLRTLSFAVLAVAAAAIGLIFGVMSNTVDELSAEILQQRADAILASADLSDDTVVAVPILYYDQKMDECVDLYSAETQTLLNTRQFEWKKCGYYVSEVEPGLVEAELNSQYLPVAVGGDLLSNRGVKQANFARWFSQVDELSKSYAGALKLSYNSNAASFSYVSESFYPLDEIAFDDGVWEDGHNHLFTFSLGVPFQVLANGDESFTILADDDTWVFVGRDLVLDMGGIHEAVVGSFKINEAGEVYASVDGEDFAYSGVKINSGEGAIVRIFHADRDGESSVLKLNFSNMVLNITNSSLAKSDGGVEVAYDPTNPSYVAPLGESLIVNPNHTKSLVLAITVQAMLLGVFAVVLVVTISLAWRYWHHGHNLVG